MRITRYAQRITISCTVHEFEILGIAVDQLEAGDPRDQLTETGHRRAWSRRTRNGSGEYGSFLRVDHDVRTEDQK